MKDRIQEQVLTRQVEELCRYAIELNKTISKLSEAISTLQEQIVWQNLKLVNIKYEILDPRNEEQILPLPIIRNADELLDKLLIEKNSLARFGDGEFSIMDGIKRCGFQHPDDKLAKRLKEVIESEEENLLIGIADNYGSLEKYTDAAALAIRSYMSPQTRQRHWKYLKENRIYYDAYVTRPYVIYKDKTNTISRFQKIRQLWENREVIIVEGAKTRFGVGNDLLFNAKKVKRILAPAESAFDRYDDIFQASLKCAERDILYLVALGPSADVLVYDLCKNGYQAIDIGHLDIEYEWFIHVQEQRGPVKYKYNNEVVGGNKVDDSGLPKEYFEQIIIDYSI